LSNKAPKKITLIFGLAVTIRLDETRLECRLGTAEPIFTEV